MVILDCSGSDFMVKIGIVSTGVYRCPPKSYGGTELVAYYQAKVLSRNHDVYLFTVDETPDIDNVTVFKCGSEFKVSEDIMYLKYKEVANSLDIIIDNSSMGYPFMLYKDFPNTNVKVIHVFHSGIPFKTNPPIDKHKINYLAVSKWYADLIADVYNVPYGCSYIYNGIDTSIYKPDKIEKGNYLLFLSVLLPDKGIFKAIELALETNKKLIIAGSRPSTLYGNAYIEFEENLLKYINKHTDSIEFLGEVSNGKKIDLLQHANALLLPLSYTRPEYFGLVYLEALASGTPVITSSIGSAYELAHLSKNNSILLSVDRNDYIKNINKVFKYNNNDYENCIKYVNKYFSLDVFAKEYEKLVKEVKNRW